MPISLQPVGPRSPLIVQYPCECPPGQQGSYPGIYLESPPGMLGDLGLKVVGMPQ